MTLVSDVLKIVKQEEPFKVAKACQILEQVLQLPNIILINQVSEQFIDWIVEVLRHENHIILTDILSCIAVAVNLKEVKQTKVRLKFLSKNEFVQSWFCFSVKIRAWRNCLVLLDS